jgi:hypothetical protein
MTGTWRRRRECVDRLAKTELRLGETYSVCAIDELVW